MRRLLVPLGLAAAWLSPVPTLAQPAASPDALTFERALALAFEHHPALSAAGNALAATDGATLQARARPNPSLSTLVEDTRHATRTVTTTLDIPIELGGQRAARIAAAEREHDVAAAAFDDAKAQLRAAVVGAWVEALAAQERVRLADDATTLARRAADVATRRVTAGKVSPIDETRARVDLANAELEAADAGAHLATARATLAALWGDTQPRVVELAGDLPVLPASVDLDRLLAELDAAPLRRAGRGTVALAQARADLERRQGVPDLTLSVGAKRDNALGLTQAVIGVSVPLPLFDRRQGAALEASRRAAQAEDDDRAARLQAVAALQQAARRLGLAQETLRRLAELVIPAAQQASDAASTGYAAGKFALLDVLDAQRALLQARTRRLATLVAAQQAAADIDRILGRPTPR